MSEIRGWGRPDKLIEGLLQKPQAARPTFARNCRRLHQIACVAELVRGSVECRFRRPAESLDLAELATVVAGYLPGGRASLDAQAEAWATYGNTLKIVGRFGDAERALATSARLEAGTTCHLLTARRLEYLASLRTRQGRQRAAVKLLHSAARFRLRSDDPAATAAVRLQLSIALTEMGSHAEAYAEATSAAEILKPVWSEHPRLALQTWSHMARVLLDAGHPLEAARMLARIKGVHCLVGDPLLWFRRLWLEGQIAAALGDEFQLRAIELLKEAQALFMAESMLYEVACIALDLAHLHARRGEPDAVAAVIKDALPVFAALGLGSDTIAARHLASVAARSGLAEALLPVVARHLRRSAAA
jgi:hypothetical protein